MLKTSLDRIDEQTFAFLELLTEPKTFRLVKLIMRHWIREEEK